MNYRMRHIRALPCLTAIALSTSLLSVAAMAETIYKSVDAEGNVTFSSTPPAGVEAQQIELQPAPTQAEEQQSIEEMKNLEEESNALDQEVTPPPQEQEETAVQPDPEYQQDAGDEDPVYVGDGYVGDPDRNERVRDGVDDVRDVVPRPAEAGHAAGRAR
jgi:hypothetical protein